MRRKAERIPGALRIGILSNFTDAQLKLIGSVAIAYNGCEHVLHNITGDCIQFSGNPRVVTTRINGTEGLTAIITDACKRFSELNGLTAEITKTLKGEGFATLKKHRDSVVHCMPYNFVGIGRLTRRQAESYDVLLTEPALEWLSESLVALHKEMGALNPVIRHARDISLSDASSERKTQLSVDLRHAIFLYREAQSQRLGMNKPPEFPEAKNIPH